MRTGSALARAMGFLAVWTLARAGSTAAAAEPDVVLRPISSAGEPGEEVAIEFRADAKVPIADASIQLDLSRTAAEILRTSVEGSAAAHVIPQGIIFDPHFFTGGYRVGVRMIAGTQRSQIEAGQDILLFKVIFRVRADAPQGVYPLKLGTIEFTKAPRGVTTLTHEAVEGASLTVRASDRPRPVQSVTCTQARAHVTLTWSNTAAYDGLLLSRNGGTIATLPGDAIAYEDSPSPGPTSYTISAKRGELSSLPSSCGLIVDIPRPEPVSDFTCSTAGKITTLSWKNGGAYDSISLFRNGQLLSKVPGDARTFEDAWSSTLFTVYSLKAFADGVGSLPASCKLNELSKDYFIWAEEARAEPGATHVPIRVFITNPKPLQGIQLGMRMDPDLVRMRELSVAGTVSEAAAYDYFAYQQFYLPGETGAGLQFDTIPPYGSRFPSGADQHFLTVFVDVPETTPGSTSVPLEIGAFGQPQIDASVSAEGVSVNCRTANGALLIGSSPVPEVEGARADAAHALGGPEPQGAGPRTGVMLTWRNAGEYTGLRVERDGQELDGLAGGETLYVDSDAGPGLHRYRIVAQAGRLESFPVVVTTRPAGVPGTFLRGDADADGRVALSDAVVTILYLFRGGNPPPCLDASDADDNGSLNISDPLDILLHLFLGSGPLPLPGPDAAWFDPTLDELGCE